MVKGYATIAQRMLFVIVAITLSSQLHAGAHCIMASPKRHKMSCKQRVLLLLGLAAAAQGASASYAYKASAYTANGALVSTNVPVCDLHNANKLEVAGTMGSLLKQRVNGVNLELAAHVLHPVELPNGLRGVAHLCVPLWELRSEHIDGAGSLQLAAPQEQ